jgi:hypothetical protein
MVHFFSNIFELLHIRSNKSTTFFNEYHPVVLLILQKIKSLSVQTQVDSIYYVELHFSTYLRSSRGSKVVFKTYIYFFCMARQPYMGLGLLISSRLHGHTHLRHTTVGRTPLDE